MSHGTDKENLFCTGREADALLVEAPAFGCENTLGAGSRQLIVDRCLFLDKQAQVAAVPRMRMCTTHKHLYSLIV